MLIIVIDFKEFLSQIFYQIQLYSIMDLMKIIQSQLTDVVLDQIAGQIGGNREQTATASNGILNTLIGALAKNSSNEDGAASLFNALEKDHDGSLLDNLSDYINPAAPHPVSERTANGAGILSHLLGDKANLLTQLIGQETGLSKEGAFGLMTKLAPIVLAALGKQKKQGGFNVSDLMGFLSNENQGMRQRQMEEQRRLEEEQRRIEAQRKQQSGVGNFMKLLDFDGDGSGLDDAMGMLGKLFKK